MGIRSKKDIHGNRNISLTLQIFIIDIVSNDNTKNMIAHLSFLVRFVAILWSTCSSDHETGKKIAKVEVILSLLLRIKNLDKILFRLLEDSLSLESLIISYNEERGHAVPRLL